MAITFELPSDIETRLRAETPNFDAEAKEATLVELFRQDKLTRYELSLALGLDRFETDGLLKKHNVTEDPPTAQELEEDHCPRPSAPPAKKANRSPASKAWAK